jgi:hypothetical protein
MDAGLTPSLPENRDRLSPRERGAVTAKLVVTLFNSPKGENKDYLIRWQRSLNSPL